MASRAAVALATVAVVGLIFWALRPIVDVVLVVFAGVLLAVFLRGISDWLSRLHIFICSLAG